MSSINGESLKLKNGFSNYGNSSYFISVIINLPKGLKKQIKIDKNSNIGNLSFEFCKNNNLNFQNLLILKSELENIQKKFERNLNYVVNLDNKSEKDIQKKNENKKSEKIKIIDESEQNKKSIKINKSHHNLNNSIKKNQKLFPYEFKIKLNLKNNNKINKNNELKENKKTEINKSKSLKKNNNNISRNLSNKKRENIFERLFKDSEIKRISYKRPCHFSSSIRNKSNNSSSHILDNSTHLSFNKTNNNITLLSSYTNFNNENKNYERSYIIKKFNFNLSNPDLKKFFIRKNKKKLQRRNEIKINNRNYDKNSKSGKLYYTVNIPNEKNIKKNNNDYIPLKKKYLWNVNQSGDLYLENIRQESFTKLFKELNNNSNELNEKNLKIETIPLNFLYHINPIINEIYKNKKKYDLNNFIKEMGKIFNNFTFEEKRNFVNLYKNKNEIYSYSYLNTAPESEKRFKTKKNLFNTSQLSKINSLKGINILLMNKSNDTLNKKKSNLNSKSKTGIEKKKNFYYI